MLTIMPNRVPRPTEYQGVLFRSKTEAVFARALDLWQMMWEYEPKRLQLHDGYIPDFLAINKVKHGICMFVFEVKPGEPSLSYMDELARRFSSLKSGNQLFNFKLIYGNFFDKSEPKTLLTLRMENDVPIWVSVGDDMNPAINDALDYRFDLKS